MSSLLKTLLSNAHELKDLEPNLNSLTESDTAYFNVKEANLPHPTAFATKKTYMETNFLPSNFVPTFWSDSFAPHNNKHQITVALRRIVERGVNDIEDFCVSCFFSRRVLSNVVAIDANRCDVKKQNQYDKYWIDRELNKAHVAFESKNISDRPVATGNWGCGVFGGDLQLKALVQIIAASKAGRDVIYSPFTEKKFAKELQRLVEVLEKKRVTVGELYRILLEYREDGRLDLFDFVKKRVTGST